jgi:1,4-alpha-glucan branching enzyme
MAETDIDTYLVVNKSGEIVGSVVHEDHTAIRGFNRTQTLIQKDAKGNIIVDEQWNGD